MVLRIFIYLRFGLLILITKLLELWWGAHEG